MASAMMVLPSKGLPEGTRHDVTHFLNAWSAGDPKAIASLVPLVEADIRRLARSLMARQAPGHTLQPTALVNEAYLRLFGHRPQSWENRQHFIAYMATVMRRLLVNHARHRSVLKRGGEATHIALDEALDQPRGCRPGVPGEERMVGGRVDLLDLDRALRRLSALDPRQGRIVELRYFGGLTLDESAKALGISVRTVKREWRSARLWLLRALGDCD